MATEKYKYDTREVTHGVQRAAYATITNEEGKVAFGKPASYTGMRGVNIETTQEQNKFFADDQTHIVLNSAKSTEGSFTCYQFPKDFLTSHLGKKVHDNGGLTDTGTFKSFAFQWIETVEDEFGEKFDELHVLYNVKATTPTAEAATDEDSTEPKEFEVPVTAAVNNGVLDKDGEATTEMVLRKTKENEELFNTFMDKIILPTDAIPSGAN